MESYAVTLWVVAENDYQARRLGEIAEDAMNSRLDHYGRTKSAKLQRVRPLRKRWRIRRVIRSA